MFWPLDKMIKNMNVNYGKVPYFKAISQATLSCYFKPAA